MIYEQFLHCHSKGWKITKILEYLGRDSFEREETLLEFKSHFSTYIGSK